MPNSDGTFDMVHSKDFDVFVQSTSVNRVLLPGTEFLYEIEEEEGTVRGGGGEGEGRGGEGRGGEGRGGEGRRGEANLFSDV